VDTLEQAIIFIRKLWAGEEAFYKGHLVAPQKPRKTIPIYITALGPKMLKLAGRLADGVLVPTGVSPALVEYAIRNIKAGIAERSKSLGHIDIGWWTSYSFLSDIKQAEDEVRPWVAMMLNSYMRLNPSSIPSEIMQDIPESLRATDESGSHGTFSFSKAMLGGVNSQTISKLAITGGTEECISKIETLRRAGANKVHLALYTTKDYNGFFEKFSSKIMPYFR
jgi:5,10-methylenetetrahydromethanopterin reductase